jgi:hypothetical protein
MIRIASLSVAGALLACGLSAAPAQAGPNRTWVSGHGTDSGACTLAAPCRTFAFALTQTAAAGEIDVLDPAGYGPVIITKAISIVNDDVGVAAIEALSGDRGKWHLFKTGGNLAIENCVIRNFGGGINIVSGGSFSVSNTIASNNGLFGISIESFAAAATGVLSKVTANNNGGAGIKLSLPSFFGKSLKVTIVDSEASNNGSDGVEAISTSPFPPPSPSRCAVSLPAATASTDFTRRGRVPFFGSRIRWSLGMVPEWRQSAAARYSATATTISMETRTTAQAF